MPGSTSTGRARQRYKYLYKMTVLVVVGVHRKKVRRTTQDATRSPDWFCLSGPLDWFFRLVLSTSTSAYTQNRLVCMLAMALIGGSASVHSAVDRAPHGPISAFFVFIVLCIRNLHGFLSLCVTVDYLCMMSVSSRLSVWTLEWEKRIDSVSVSRAEQTPTTHTHKQLRSAKYRSDKCSKKANPIL